MKEVFTIVVKRTEDIISELQQRISRGDFGKTGRLPTLEQLCEETGVARETMNRAIQLMQARGILVVRGRSLYVAPERVKFPAMLPHWESYLRDLGLEPVSEFVESPDFVPCPPEIARRMQVAEETPVIRRLLRQGAKLATTPQFYRLSENFYHPSLYDASILPSIQSSPEFDTMPVIKAKHGAYVVQAHVEATSRLPTEEERKRLKIVAATPVTELYRTSKANTGLVLMVNHITLVATFFLLEYDLDVPFWK